MIGRAYLVDTLHKYVVPGAALGKAVTKDIRRRELHIDTSTYRNPQ